MRGWGHIGVVGREGRADADAAWDNGPVVGWDSGRLDSIPGSTTMELLCDPGYVTAPLFPLPTFVCLDMSFSGQGLCLCSAWQDGAPILVVCVHAMPGTTRSPVTVCLCRA